MKHLIPFILLILLGCSSEETKVRKIIADKINKDLPEGWIYTPLSFSLLKDALSNINNEDKYKELKEKYDKLYYNYIYDSLLYQEQYESDSAFYGVEYAKQNNISPVTPYEMKSLEKEISDLKQLYTPHIIGKCIIHDYLCKTNFGDSLYTSYYIFDKDLNIIYTKKQSCFIEKDSINSIIEMAKKEEPYDPSKLEFLFY